MLEKFLQNNKAENIRRWINSVNLDSADILNTEKEIYSALKKANRRQSWQATPVAPLAEPVDMTALVGDLFNGANQEIGYHIGRVDDFYTWLADTNNVLKAELESVEKLVTQATDDIQDISIVIGDENKNFYWVSDSFNNTTFVDSNASTSLVDTDYGAALLGAVELRTISSLTANINREITNGIPGANLYIVNPGTRGNNAEPQPILEATDSRNFGSILDSDPSSWFEIERNFIPPRQKIKMQFGRAFTYTESGEEKDVREITKNYDWTANVQWPDGYQDSGPDGKGLPLAEWRNLDTENPMLGSSASNNLLNTDAVLGIDLSLRNPTSLSYIRILPFTREDSSPITIKNLEVYSGENAITVARDIELGSNRSTTKLQREILRRTGPQTTGSLLAIPTDRDITDIKIVLTSPPAKVKNGFAHIFKDVLTEYRTERNHLLWRTADQWKDWSRRGYNENVPQFTTSSSRPGLVGTLLDAANVAYSLGRTIKANDASKPLPTPSTAAKQGVNAVIGDKAIKLTGSLGSAGAWLGKTVPVLGAVLALDNLVGGFFAVDKSANVLEARIGYDIFKGHRAAVGIRDITLLKVVYTNESIIQSTKREFSGPVSKIGLFVDEYIPEHWGAGNWITYFISTDGTEWKAIPKLTDSTLEKSLVLTNPTKFVYFKAVIKGNSADPFHSPQLKHYALQGLPVG